jgi:hypothetical protein
MKLVLLALLLCLTPVAAHTDDKQSPNPADYKMSLHVVYSRTNTAYAIDYQGHLELSGFARTGNFLLWPADYPARQVPCPDHPPINPKDAFDTNVCYEVLASTGQTRVFAVTGRGYGQDPWPPGTN